MIAIAIYKACKATYKTHPDLYPEFKDITLSDIDIDKDIVWKFRGDRFSIVSKEPNVNNASEIVDNLGKKYWIYKV